MPTIPTITAQTRPTAEAPSTTGGTTIDPSQNIATATAPVSYTHLTLPTNREV